MVKHFLKSFIRGLSQIMQKSLRLAHLDIPAYGLELEGTYCLGIVCGKRVPKRKIFEAKIDGRYLPNGVHLKA